MQSFVCLRDSDGHISISAGGLTTATPQAWKQAVLILSTHTEKKQDLGPRRTRHGPCRERERARERRGGGEVSSVMRSPHPARVCVNRVQFYLSLEHHGSEQDFIMHLTHQTGLSPRGCPRSGKKLHFRRDL